MDKLDTILKKMNSQQAQNNRWPLNVIPLFKAGIARQMQTHVHSQKVVKSVQKKVQCKIEWSDYFIKLLVIVLTLFLITEAARFYLSMNDSKFEAFLKASLLEGIVIAFSVMKAKTTLSRAVYRLMIVVIYCYTVYVISGLGIHTAINQQNLIHLGKQSVQDLELEYSQTRELKDRLMKLERLTQARSYDVRLASVQLKLDQARQSLVQMPDSVVIWNALAIALLFRVIVMLSNVLCLGYLSSKDRR